MLTIKTTAPNQRSVYWRFAPDRAPVLLGKLRRKRGQWSAVDRDGKPAGRFPTPNAAADALRKRIVDPLIAEALGQKPATSRTLAPGPTPGASPVPTAPRPDQSLPTAPRPDPSLPTAPRPHPVYGTPPWRAV